MVLNEKSFVEIRTEELNHLNGKAKILGKLVVETYQARYSDRYTKENDLFVEIFKSNPKSFKELWINALNDFFSELYDKDLKDKIEGMFYIIAKSPYTQGIYRRSLRSKNPQFYKQKILMLLNCVFFDWNKFDFCNFLTLSASEINEKKIITPDRGIMEMLMAYEINCGNPDIIKNVKNIVLSENNHVVLTHWVIRGVFKSDDEELHKLICDVLLAAKLQEGLRQAVVESADSGTLKAHIMVMKIIIDNNLSRFSSVIRAVGTWMGLGYDYEDKKIINKLLVNGCEFLQKEEERKAAIESDDMLLLYLSCWAESSLEVESLKAMINILSKGPKYKRLAAFYFLSETGDHNFRRELAAKYLDSKDLDILTYVVGNYDTVSMDRYDRTRYLKILRTNEYLKNEKVRKRDFDLLLEVFKLVRKSEYRIIGKPFDWCYSEISGSRVFEQMFHITAFDCNLERTKTLIEICKDVSSDYRIDIIDVLVKPESEFDQEFLFSSLKDKSIAVRIQAIKKYLIQELVLLALKELKICLALKLLKYE